MNCQHCKDSKATVDCKRKTLKGVIVILHLCPDCARLLGYCIGCGIKVGDKDELTMRRDGMCQGCYDDMSEDFTDI